MRRDPCYLHSTGQIVLKTLIIRTCRTVGEIVRVEMELCHWYSVHGMDASLGKIERPAEVGGVQFEGVHHVGRAWGEQPVRGAPHSPTLPLVGWVGGGVIPGHDLPKVRNVILSSSHL